MFGTAIKVTFIQTESFKIKFIGKSADDCAKAYINLVKEVLPVDAASI